MSVNSIQMDIAQLQSRISIATVQLQGYERQGLTADASRTRADIQRMEARLATLNSQLIAEKQAQAQRESDKLQIRLHNEAMAQQRELYNHSASSRAPEPSEEEQLVNYIKYVQNERIWVEEHRKEVAQAAEEVTHLKELEDDYKKKFKEAPLEYSLLTDIERINPIPKLSFKKIIISGAAGSLLGLILAIIFRKQIISNCPFLWANSTVYSDGSVIYNISKGTQSLVTLLIILFSAAVFLVGRYLQEKRIFDEDLKKAKALEEAISQLDEKQLATVNARKKYYTYYDSINVIKDRQIMHRAKTAYSGKSEMPEAYNYNLSYDFTDWCFGEKDLCESCGISTSIEKSITADEPGEEKKRIKNTIKCSVIRVVVVLAVIIGFIAVSKAMFKVDVGSSETDNDKGTVYSDETNTTEDQAITGDQTESDSQIDIGDAYFVPGRIYYTQDVLKVREGPGKNYRQLSRDELVDEDYDNSEDYPEACLKKGSPVTCLDMSDEWMHISSGWICTFDNGEDLVK